MPYATPMSPVPSSSTTMTATTRPAHRRTRSAFSNESGPGAFVSLGSLPRRRPSATSNKKAVFHFSEDDDSPQEHDSADTLSRSLSPEASSSYATPNSLRLSMQSGRFSPSTAPPPRIEIPQANIGSTGGQPSYMNAVPFPSSSPSAERLSFMPPSPPHTGSLPRSPSSSIILSNGKPLKSSLKSSSSSPNVAAEFTTTTNGESQQRMHFRAQSAPSTPRVHFAEKDAGLESVRLFKSSGKPASVSKPSGEETETETEAENSYPFPLLSSSSSLFPSSSLAAAGSSGTAHHHNQLVHEIDTSAGITSSIPNTSPSPTANVFLETVTLPRTRPPTLRGTVLVRNLAFEKNVAVRFTLDDWQTTSEVLCKHVVSLPGLPPPFPRSLSARPKTMGDVAASLASGEPLDGPKEDDNNGKLTWDRFSFTIRLEDYETKLADRTLYLVARYVSPAGEFWDNNDSANYRVGFRRASTSPLPTPLGTPRTIANTLFPTGAPAASSAVTSQQRTFSAPSSLKCTPVTGSTAAVNRVTADRRNVAAVLPALTIRTQGANEEDSEVEKTPVEKDVEGGEKPVPSLLPVPAPLLRRHSAPQNPDSVHSDNIQHFPSPLPAYFNTVPQGAAKNQTSKYLARRLSLTNYVAPSPPSSSSKDAVGKDGLALATPPLTPPRETRLLDLPNSASTSPTKLSPLVLIGGMPATMPSTPPASVPLPLSSSSSSSSSSSPSSSASSSRSSSYSDMYPLNVTTAHLPDTNADADDVPLPFSPTSRSGNGLKMSSLGAQLVLSQLASPPVSNEGSEASSPASSGRNSPTRRVKEGRARRESPTRLGLPSLQDAFLEDVKKLSPIDDNDLTPTATDVQPQRAGPVQLPNSSSTRLDPTDSSYAAFVRQWCFAQSTPPTGTISSTGGSPGAGSGAATPTPNTNGVGFGIGPGMLGSQGPVPRRQQAWPGDSQNGGYGFPGFGFGAVGASKRHHEGPGTAMVGGEFHSSASPAGTSPSGGSMPGYGRGIVV